MRDQAMRWLVFWTAAMGLMRSSVFGAEPLPPRALARIGDHRFYHGPGITCVALSPDGRRAASAAKTPGSDESEDKDQSDYNQLIVLWDAATGRRLHELHVPQGAVSRLAFSPDGKRLAASYAISEDDSEPKSGVVLFDVDAGTLFRRLSEFQAELGFLQFSPDGKQLRVSERNGPVSAWDATTGKRLHLWKPPPSKTLSKGRHKEGAVEGVMAPDDRVIVWEIACCSMGGCPSVWMDGLRVHDAETNKLLYQKKFIDPDKDSSERESSHHELNWSFAFTADGKRLMADGDDKLLVWEAATGRELKTIKVPGMLRFALAPEGRHAVIEEIAEHGREHSRFRLWEIGTGKPVRELLSAFERWKYAPAPPSFSTNGKTLLIATDTTLRLFDAATGEERADFGHRAPVTSLFSGDGRTLDTSCAERRCRWNVSGKEPTLLRHESRNAWEADCLAHSADGKLSLDYHFGLLEEHSCVRETATGRTLHTLPGHAHFAAFSPDAKRLLLSSRHSEGCYHLRLYEVQTGKKSGEIQKMEQRGEPVFSPNGRLLAWADRTGVVHLHDAVTGKSVHELHPSRPLPETDKIYLAFSLLYSPDGEKLIAAGDLTEHSESGSGGTSQQPLRVFQTSSGRQSAELYANPEKGTRAAELSCMACSPDGRLLAVAEKGSGVVRVLEIASGGVRAEFAGHRHGVHGLVFASDGKTLASGGEDNVVFLWDVTGARTPSAVKAPRQNGLNSLWDDLASEDSQNAGVAIASLLRKPEASVSFLRENLHPEEATSEKRLAQLIADLDADAYVMREAASRELIHLDERAEAALRRALRNRPTLEMRRRIEDILDRLEPSSPPPETLRKLRAIEVLEHANTPAARHCLEVLAKGAAEARQTREAKAALRRLANHRAPDPRPKIPPPG